MKKTTCLCGAIIALSAFAATGADVAVVTSDAAPAVEVTLDSETRGRFIKHFTDRFYLAAKLTGVKEFSHSEKQHLEAAAARYADGSFKVFQKNNLIPSVAKLEKDPKVDAIMEKMLNSKTPEDMLICARELSDYIHNNYPELTKSEVISDMQNCRLQFLKEVEEIPSMPKLAEKSIYTFWDSVLTPGFR